LKKYNVYNPFTKEHKNFDSAQEAWDHVANLPLSERHRWRYRGLKTVEEVRKLYEVSLTYVFEAASPDEAASQFSDTVQTQGAAHFVKVREDGLDTGVDDRLIFTINIDGGENDD